MPRSYNIVLNSLFCTAGSAANLPTDKSYFVDWSAYLPQGEYEVTFSFISEGNQLTTFPTMPLVYIDLLSQADIKAPQAVFQATSSNFLGALHPTLFHPTTNYIYFRAEHNTNNPIYMSNRPYNNEFRVQILNNSNPPIAYVDQNATPQPVNDYVLNLNFKLLKEAK